MIKWLLWRWVSTLWSWDSYIVGSITQLWQNVWEKLEKPFVNQYLHISLIIPPFDT